MGLNIMGIRNRQVMPKTVGNEARLNWKARCSRTVCSALEEGGGGGEEEGEVGGGGGGSEGGGG
jgi:hypothetical protein